MAVLFDFNMVVVPPKSGGGPPHSMTLCAQAGNLAKRGSVLNCASPAAFTALSVLFLHSAFYLLGRISVLSSGWQFNPKGIVSFSPRLPRFFGATLGPRPEMVTTPTALWPR